MPSFPCNLVSSSNGSPASIPRSTSAQLKSVLILLRDSAASRNRLPSPRPCRGSAHCGGPRCAFAGAGLRSNALELSRKAYRFALLICFPPDLFPLWRRYPMSGTIPAKSSLHYSQTHENKESSKFLEFVTLFGFCHVAEPLVPKPFHVTRTEKKQARDHYGYY